MAVIFEHIIKFGKEKIENYPQIKITLPVSSFFILLFGWIAVYPNSFYQTYYNLLFSVHEHFPFIFIISTLLIALSIKLKTPFLNSSLITIGIFGLALGILKIQSINRFNEPTIGIISSSHSSFTANNFEKFIVDNLQYRQDINLKVVKYYYSTNNTQDAVENLKKAKHDNLDILLIDSYLPISDLSKSQLQKLINPYTLYLTTKPLKKDIVRDHENIIAVSPKLTSELYEITKKINIEADTIFYISCNDNYGEYCVKKLKHLFKALRINPIKYIKLNTLNEIEKMKVGSTLFYIKLDNEEVIIPESQTGKVNIITHSDILLNHVSYSATIQDSFFDTDYLETQKKDAKLEVIKIISSSFYDKGRPLEFNNFKRHVSSELFEQFLIELTIEGEILYKYK